MKIETVFFAGGTKGVNARADGRGGLLQRGWYFILHKTKYGPFKSKTQAWLVWSIESSSSNRRMVAAELIGGEFLSLKALRKQGILSENGLYFNPGAREKITSVW